MIPTLLGKAAHAAVAVSGGRDSLIVLDQVRKVRPDIEVLVFKTDFTANQWKVIDNLIRLWDLTVMAPPPKASYLIPNGEQLARVDEYDVGVGVTIPVLRDLVHSERCLWDLENRYLPVSPLGYDLLFVGSRQGDSSPATGQPLHKAVSRIGNMTIASPIYYWTDEQVREASKELPYAREWYEEGDASFDTGNLLACSRCVDSGDGRPVCCPKQGRVIKGHEWDKPLMLKTFREKFGFLDSR